MRRNPLYAFKDRTSVGIFDIPLNTTVHILNRGDGQPIFVEIIAKTGLSASSTIGQFLDDSTLYIDLGNSSTVPSELEKIEEDGKQGWRLLGKNPDNYGNTGEQAVDLSNSTVTSTVNGSTGSDSFATGTNTSASENSSTAMGISTIANVEGGTVVGMFNDAEHGHGYQSPKMFQVGVGSAEYDRKTGLVVFADGIVCAPEMQMAEIQNGTSDTLVTKEYSDDIDGGNL
jgi:hypothetical protein